MRSPSHVAHLTHANHDFAIDAGRIEARHRKAAASVFISLMIIFASQISEAGAVINLEFPAGTAELTTAGFCTKDLDRRLRPGSLAAPAGLSLDTPVSGGEFRCDDCAGAMLVVGVGRTGKSCSGTYFPAGGLSFTIPVESATPPYLPTAEPIRVTFAPTAPVALGIMLQCFNFQTSVALDASSPLPRTYHFTYSVTDARDGAPSTAPPVRTWSVTTADCTGRLLPFIPAPPPPVFVNSSTPTGSAAGAEPLATVDVPLGAGCPTLEMQPSVPEASGVTHRVLRTVDKPNLLSTLRLVGGVPDAPVNLARIDMCGARDYLGAAAEPIGTDSYTDLLPFLPRYFVGGIDSICTRLSPIVALPYAASNFSYAAAGRPDIAGTVRWVFGVSTYSLGARWPTCSVNLTDGTSYSAELDIHLPADATESTLTARPSVAAGGTAWAMYYAPSEALEGYPPGGWNGTMDLVPPVTLVALPAFVFEACLSITQVRSQQNKPLARTNRWLLHCDCDSELDRRLSLHQTSRLLRDLAAVCARPYFRPLLHAALHHQCH